MVRKSILAIIAALAWASLAYAQHPSVTIVGMTQGDATSQGSGCIIASDARTNTVLVLTAKHVVSGGGQVWCNPPGTGKRFNATSVQRHPSLDLATFIVPRAGLEDREPMRLWTGELKAGTAVYSEGFGNVENWPTSVIGQPIWKHGSYAFARLKGHVQETRYTNSGIADFSLPSIPGDSGSPIFVSYQDRPYLVGVTMASDYATGRPTVTTAPHIGPIRRWIDTLGWRIRRARDQAEIYTYSSRVDTSGCVLFGRGILFGRNHPAPYQGPQCIPGQGCIPQGGGGQAPGLEEEYAPSPGEFPQFPQPTPAPQPQPTPAPQPERTYTLPGRLRAEFDVEGLKRDILDEMAKDSRFRGRDGKDGRDGSPGARGPAGPAGPAGDTASVDLDLMKQELLLAMRADPKFRGPPGQEAQVDVNKLSQQIVQALPPINVQIVDPKTGEVIDQQTQPLGGTFKFELRSSRHLGVGE